MHKVEINKVISILSDDTTVLWEKWYNNVFWKVLLSIGVCIKSKLIIEYRWDSRVVAMSNHRVHRCSHINKISQIIFQVQKIPSQTKNKSVTTNIIFLLVKVTCNISISFSFCTSRMLNVKFLDLVVGSLMTKGCPIIA
jgi:hypothetical protein